MAHQTFVVTFVVATIRSVSGMGSNANAGVLLRRGDLRPPDGIFSVPPAALKRDLLLPTYGTKLLTDGLWLCQSCEICASKKSSSDCVMDKSDKKLPVELISFPYISSQCRSELRYSNYRIVLLIVSLFRNGWMD
uniref:Uncharacterized protein n=1 Tax=Glossina austeni TaxID=7395 RepID=A0A1A9V7Z4_GLOAU